MKNLMKIARRYGVSVFIAGCLFAVPNLQNLYGGDERTTEIKSHVIVDVKWGRGRGEIGKHEIDVEPSAAGASINPIAVDNNGNIYIGDSENDRVLKFDAKGKYVFEIKLKKYYKQPSGRSIITDIHVDEENHVYVVLYNREAVGKFSADGRMVSIFDISGVGVLEKRAQGDVMLNVKAFFGINRVRVDKRGYVYILGTDLLKLNQEGKIIKRWGPYATNAMSFLFIDNEDQLYLWLPPEQSKEMYKRYDKNGNFIGAGLGLYDGIVEPFYMDSAGNVYGYSSNDDTNLLRYNKDKKVIKYPLGYPYVGFEENWTIDRKGNVYYTETRKDKFQVIKMSVFSESKKSDMNIGPAD